MTTTPDDEICDPAACTCAFLVAAEHVRGEYPLWVSASDTSLRLGT